MFIDAESERRGGWWKAERDPPEPLRAGAKQCKDGLGNTAKSLIITLHMAVFSTAFVTKLSAQ